MEAIDYFKIIHKYIDPSSRTYALYLPHVALVTVRALKVARRLGLPPERLRFIEEAAMLHDIGIVAVRDDDLACTGNLPYICHISEGRRILEAESLPRHALVAERHIGVGLSRTQIIEQGLPLPARDMLPETLEEKIISWADLFSSKHPSRLWAERTVADVEASLARRGDGDLQVFRAWQDSFGG
ncbi:MAG: HD domain-containing protein [Anaerolineae bacterium]